MTPAETAPASVRTEFRRRDYRAEEYASALPRAPAHDHPLALPLSSSTQVDVTDEEKVDFNDPLRVHSPNLAGPLQDGHYSHNTSIRRLSYEIVQTSTKEWAVFRSSLMQKFPYSSTVSLSATSIIIARSSKEYDKSLASLHLEELDDPEKVAKEEAKVVTRQEYISRLQKLKGEIAQAWKSDDRVTALKLTIKVARLLMDTSVLQFYPMLFTSVIDVMDMLGNLVWERIKWKAEHADDGTLVYSLPETFVSGDICSDAKETCYNWFCKIGSIRELLPRIYMELAILRCWRFLEDHPLHNLERLTMMMRGLADPLASAYCHLYMSRSAQTLLPGDIGYLIKSISDISIPLRQIIFGKETINSHPYKNKKILINLLEPAIDWIMRCLFMEAHQKHDDILAEFGLGVNLSEATGNVPLMSIVLHYLLKQLPAEVISANALEIVDLFEQHKDISLDQHLNYRLLGFKLCEIEPSVGSVDPVLRKVVQVVSQYDGLNEYLMVADAYLDIVLNYSMDNYLSIILDGISKRAQTKRVDENELDSLQSILIKLINHFSRLEDAFALNHFMEILDVLYGSSRNTVNMHILIKATRSGLIHDPRTIQLLFEISQALLNSIDISSMKDDYLQRACLISRFVQMVDFGARRDHHLTFLVECRASFGHIEELKDTLVHLSNSLAVKAIKDADKFLSFFKACMAFNEVTIPSISASIRRINLYIVTAEVALFGGLVSHAEGLIYSAISCMQCFDLTEGCIRPIDVDRFLSLACKLCSILVMIPGNHEEGIVSMPERILASVNYQSLKLPKVKVKTLCAIISLLATLSQDKLPYHAMSGEVMGNDLLFFGEPSYYQELSSVSSLAVHNLVDVIEQEPNSVLRGTLALEACNCLMISLKASDDLSLICSRMIEIAKPSLNPKDKYLQSTMNIFDKHFSSM